MRRGRGRPPTVHQCFACKKINEGAANIRLHESRCEGLRRILEAESTHHHETQEYYDSLPPMAQDPQTPQRQHRKRQKLATPNRSHYNRNHPAASNANNVMVQIQSPRMQVQVSVQPNQNLEVQVQQHTATLQQEVMTINQQLDIERKVRLEMEQELQLLRRQMVGNQPAPISEPTIDPPAIVEPLRWMSNKGNQMIGVDGFKYRKDKKIWRCDKQQKGCNAKLKDLVLVGTHTHPPNWSLVRRDHCKWLMRERAKTELTPMPQIYKAERNKVKLVDPVAAAFVFDEVKNQLYRTRNAQWPVIPRDIDHFLNLLESGEKLEKVLKTVDGRPFYHSFKSLPNGETMVLFGSREDWLRLAHSKRWFIDGTFKVQPKVFYQLVSIHTQVNDTSMPCIYALLTSKSQTLYENFFLEVLNACRQVDDKRFDLEEVTCDFETGLIPAIQSKLKARVVGCLFHYTQSVQRWLKNNGFMVKELSEETLRIARKFEGLAFLQPHDIAREAEALLESLPTHLKAFGDYFRKQWLTTYPPEIWSIYKRDVRTNNAVESKP